MFGHSRMNSKHDGKLCVMSSTFNQVFWIQARKCSHRLSGFAWLITKSWVVQTLCTENPLLSRVGDGLRARVSTGLADVVKITGSIPAPAPTSWTVFSGSIVAGRWDKSAQILHGPNFFFNSWYLVLLLERKSTGKLVWLTWIQLKLSFRVLSRVGREIIS